MNTAEVYFEIFCTYYQNSYYNMGLMYCPNFIIAGAQKSGTTYLQRCLQDHPDVFMPADETTYFEETDFKTVPWDTFLREFDQAGGKNAVGIKRPDYMGRKLCAENIASKLPDVKILFVLRDPVERAISAYLNFVAYSCLPVEPINNGLRNLINGHYSEYAVADEVIQFGFYHKLLMRYFKLFPREQIKVIQFEQITQHPLETMRSVYDFLGIDTSYIPKAMQSRFQVTAKSEIILKLSSLMSDLAYAYTDDRSRFEPKSMDQVESHVLGVLQQLNEKLVIPHFGGRKTPIEESLKAILRDIYSEDIMDLESELGWDLSLWKE